MAPVPQNLQEIFQPLCWIMQTFSVCPMTMKNNQVIFTWKSIRCARWVMNFLILSSYLIFLCHQVGIYWQNEQQRRNIQGYVELGYGIYGALLPIGTMILVAKNRHKVAMFYGRTTEAKRHLVGYVDRAYTFRVFRQLFCLYIFLGLASATFIGVKAWMEPRANVFILNLIQLDEIPFPFILSGVAFHVYVDIVKSCAFAYSEIVCSTLALSFVKTMKNVEALVINQNYGSSAAECDQPSFTKNGSLTTIDIDSKYYGLKPAHPIWKIGPTDAEALPSYDAYFQNMRNLKLGTVSPVPVRTEEKCISITTGGTTILECLKRFKYISEMQTLMNTVYGTILAQNVAFIVAMCCMLSFLQIKYSILLEDEKDGADIIDRLTITGNTIAAVIRLFILFTCLGNVHHTSVNFNGVLARKLLDVEDRENANLISAYLTINAVTPASVSAGGYFTFSRGTLMTTLSIITTYVIFLLQVQ